MSRFDTVRLLPFNLKSAAISIVSGPVLMASFLAFRYGLKMAPVSYAVPVRQVSIMAGVLLGMIFLGESYGRIRLASALVILAGALLIKLG